MARIGRYELKGVVGRGSMATVYEAQLAGGPERFALKVLNEPDLELMERIRREADILKRLDGRPNVVRCHEVGEERGRPYLVMDLVRGSTLADALAASRITTGDACRAVARIARALHAAHEQGVVHRDVKPSNVLLGHDGTPWIVDFGLAKDAASDSMTQSGVTVGTLAFMAPEQLDSREEVDRRTDVYALGALLYEILGGRAPFVGPAATLVQKIARDAPEPLRSLRPDVDPRLEAISLRALAKSPGDRFATAEELARALDAALAPARARSPVLLRAAASAAILLALAGAFALGRASADRGAAPPPGPRPGALLEVAAATLRSGAPLDEARLAELDAAAKDPASPEAAPLAAALPFLRARSALLRGDADAAAKAIGALPVGAPRRLVEAELAVARGDWEAASRALEAAGATSVAWSEPDAARRWTWLARACDGRSPPRASASYVRAALACAAERPHATAEIAALSDAAFAADARAACPALAPLAELVLRSPGGPLDRGDAGSIHLARRRLLLARLSRGASLPLDGAFARLGQLAASREPAVALAARPWASFVRGLGIASVDSFLATARTDADLEGVKDGIPSQILSSAGLAVASVYEMFSDLVVAKPELGESWVGFAHAAGMVGRYGEARAALDLERTRASSADERAAEEALLGQIERGVVPAISTGEKPPR